MVLALWYTGARVGELRKLTTAMIATDDPVWRAELVDHKTAWAGKSRVLLIGPRAQEALRPWLRPDRPDAPIFDPRDAGRGFNRASVSQALRRACRRAFPHPTLSGVPARERASAQCE